MYVTYMHVYWLEGGNVYVQYSRIHFLKSVSLPLEMKVNCLLPEIPIK